MSHSLIKSASWYTISKLLVMALSFVSIPIFTHLLTTSDYGIFALFTVWIGLLTPFVGLGLHLSVPRAKIEFKHSYYSYVSSIISLVLIVFLIILVVFYVFRAELLALSGIPESLGGLLMIQVLMSLFISIGTGLLQFEFRYKTVSILSLLRAILSLLFSVVLIIYIYNDLKVDGRIVGIFIVDLLLGSALAGYILCKGKVFVNFAYWKFGIIYSVPFIFGSLSYILNSQFDRVLINEYVGSSATGIYSFSYSIGMLLLLLAIAVKQAVNPWVYQKLDNNLLEPVKSVYVKYIIMFTIITILLMYISPELVMFLSDKAFWSGAEILPWIILGAYFQILILNESETQLFLKKTGINSLVIIFGAGLNVVLNFIYIPVYGMLGAAITTTFTYFSMFIALYILNLKYLIYPLVSLKCYLFSIAYVCLFSSIFFVFKEYEIFRLAVLAFNTIVLAKLYFDFKTKNMNEVQI
jgi:O-antigen/teichoic acid export membrane protein